MCDFSVTNCLQKFRHFSAEFCMSSMCYQFTAIVSTQGLIQLAVLIQPAVIKILKSINSFFHWFQQTLDQVLMVPEWSEEYNESSLAQRYCAKGREERERERERRKTTSYLVGLKDELLKHSWILWVFVRILYGMCLNILPLKNTIPWPHQDLCWVLVMFHELFF